MEAVVLKIKQEVQNETYWVENTNARCFVSKEAFELEYTELENPADVHIVYRDNQLRLTRKGSDTITRGLFVLSEKTWLNVDSENGRLHFDVITKRIDVTKDSLSFEYELYQEQNLIGHNKFAFTTEKG